MILFCYISQNIQRIKFDVSIGIIPCELIKHWQVYSRFDYYIRLGRRRCESVFFTAEDFHLRERMVYYIIKKMEAEV